MNGLTLFDNRHEMTNSTNLTENGRGVFQLHDVIHLPQAHSVECALLVLGGADAALDLLNFDSCHSLEPPSLTSEYFFYTDTTVLSHLSCITHLCERCNGSLHQVMRVRGALGLG